MKKLKFSSISILIISMFFLAIIGCAGGSDSGSGAAPKTDSESVAADIAELIDSDIQGANTDLNNITGNLTLPVTGASGTIIAWTSNPTGVIAADGTITRPASTGSDTTVILTATITKGTVTETKDFTAIVLKIPVDEQAVADDKASLVDTSIMGTNSDLDNVTTNLTLPSSGSSLSDIIWAVTSGTGISISGTTGTVTRPSYGSSDATLTITATIQKGSYSDTKIFTIIILAMSTNQASVDTERNKITVNAIGSLVTGDNALTKAQALVSPGYTVSILTTSNTLAISAIGAVVENGSSNIVFRVTKDTVTSNTISLGLTSLTYTLISGGTAYSVKTIKNLSGSLNIPSTHNGLPVTTIENNAFWTDGSGTPAWLSQTLVTSVSIPNSVTSIGENAFRYFPNASLTSLVIPDSVTSCGSMAFSEFYKGTSAKISNNMTSIPAGMFNSALLMTSIDLQNGITSIEEYAFYGCSSLTTITIPSGVTSIGNSAFDHCTSLTTVIVNAFSVPTAGSSFFASTAITEIKVPAASVSAYKIAPGWSDYSAIIISQ